MSISLRAYIAASNVATITVSTNIVPPCPTYSCSAHCHAIAAVLKRDQNGPCATKWTSHLIDFAEHEAARHNIVTKGLTGTVSGKSIATAVMAVVAAAVFFYDTR